MGSVIDKVGPLFTEIADLLGQLAGNESAWNILYSQAMEVPVGDGWTYATTSFTVPGTYGWTKDNARYVIMSADNPDMVGSEVTNDDRRNIVQQAVTDAWNREHDAWVNWNVDSAYREVSRNIWEPDPEAMSGPVDGLGYFTQWLKQQLPASAGWTSPEDPQVQKWLADLKTYWPATSHSSESFYDFWNDVNDKCALYLDAAKRLSSTSARVTAALSDFQTNLVEATTKTRDRAKEALQQWQTWKMDSGAWPSGEMTDNSGVKTILGGISYATGVVSVFPTPVALATGGISVVTGGLTYLVPDQSVAMEATKAAKADDIGTGFINDLSTMDSNMTKALDAIQTRPPNDDEITGGQGFQSYAASVVASRTDWRPPSVRI